MKTTKDVAAQLVKNNFLALQAFGLSALLALGFVWSNYKTNKRRRFNEDMLEVEWNY